MEFRTVYTNKIFSNKGNLSFTKTFAARNILICFRNIGTKLLHCGTLNGTG